MRRNGNEIIPPDTKKIWTSLDNLSILILIYK